MGRRTYPTFMLPAEPPTNGAERAKRSYRERIKEFVLPGLNLHSFCCTSL
jgi:hypothetical protein